MMSFLMFFKYSELKNILIISHFTDANSLLIFIDIDNLVRSEIWLPTLIPYKHNSNNFMYE